MRIGRTLSPRTQELMSRRVGRRAPVPLLVVLISVALAIAATTWSAVTGSWVLYGDARAHMNVARHVTDGLTPGLTQLGSVWLPLPHLLMMPLAAIDFLWHSGLVGALVGGACFVYSAVRMFSVAEEWLGTRRSAWVAWVVYVTNLNLLYVQSTALTEPVLLAFFVGTLFHLSRWTRTLSHRDLAATAAMTFCATMTRYDGWILLAAVGAVVLAWSRRRERRQHGVQANVLLFATIGTYGIILWVLYNLIIFHDPLYFIHSSFSAQSQQNALQQIGALGTKGSLSESVLSYGWAVIDVIGWPLTAVAAIGLATLALARHRNRIRDIALAIVLVSPVIFNVIALWTGQSTIRVPERAPFGMWNIRYGLMALPLAAIGAGALVRRLPKLAIPSTLAAAAAGIVLIGAATPITVADGRVGTSSAAGGRPELVASYLNTMYHGGRVLADEASASPLMYASGLDLREFVTIGFHPYYEDALLSPADSVEWIVAYDGDAIDTEMRGHSGRYSGFDLVLHDGRSRLYHRRTLLASR